MNLLYEIFNKLILKESISVNSITDSIEKRYRVAINYEGDPEHGIAPGLRTIEVYAYGLTKAGNPVIRAYQPYGDTASEVPNWKFFRLDRITSWKPTYSIVTRPAKGFNEHGDKSMSVVYSIANFSQTPDISNTTGPKQSPKIVGKLDNIESILADREKEKQRRKEQNKVISKFTKPSISTNKINEPQIDGIENITPQKIKEPEIISPDQESEPMTGQKDLSSNEKPENDIFKPNGELNQLEKVKDLNRRIDQARKIDLDKIPKK